MGSFELKPGTGNHRKRYWVSRCSSCDTDTMQPFVTVNSPKGLVSYFRCEICAAIAIAEGAATDEGATNDGTPKELPSVGL